MAKTRKFSSSPPPVGSGQPNAAAKRKRIPISNPMPLAPGTGRNQMTTPSKKQVARTAQRGQVPRSPPKNIPNRSTLIMKPGQVATDLARQSPPKPRKKYGVPEDIHTVIMAPEDDPELNRIKSNGSQGNSSSHPVSQNKKPPEIELVQHEMPSDAPPDSRLVLINNPDSEQAAAFRILRHHVLDTGRPQVVAVTSPEDGGGKTTVATNLAMALAECGRASVLLIDANIRNPKIASILRYVPPWCFKEQLKQHKDEPFSPWGFVEIASLGLHVAAIDPRKEAANQRLDATAFSLAIERLRLGPYEHIIIDCPSVLGNADVNLIQDSTDGVLLAVRNRYVTTRDIRNAVDQLTPTKIIGTAMFES